MKLYYVQIDGRRNSSWLTLADKFIHTELVLANNRKEAEAKAWDNLQSEMSPFWKDMTTRRDFKITIEDVTGEYTEDQYDDEYWTEKNIKK